MESIEIQTTQNVTLEHQIAGIGDRMLAQMLDVIFITMYYFLVLAIGTYGRKYAGDAFFYILMLPVMLYSLLFEFFFQGQTPGKMVMKTKVVKIDGTEPSFFSYFLRWIFKIVEIWSFFGVVAIIIYLINGRGQRLGDITAGTTVIRLKARTKLEDTIYTRMAEDYQVVYPEVINLTENDIQTLREIIRFMKRNDSDFAFELSQRTQTVFEKKIGRKTEQSSAKFFKTLIKDYNYIHQYGTEGKV